MRQTSGEDNDDTLPSQSKRIIIVCDNFSKLDCAEHHTLPREVSALTMPLSGSSSSSSSSSDNPFVIPSLIPPLAASSTSKGANQNENSRPHYTKNNFNENAESGKTKSSVSLLSKYGADIETTKANKSLVSASPDVGADRIIRSQRLRRPIQTNQSRRKAFSPIENHSSTSGRDAQAQRNNESSVCKSPSLFASPLPTIPRHSSSIDKYSSAKKKVLLLGETMESLFCLNKVHSTAEQYKLCNSIVDGSRIDDPGTWRRVLELTRAQYQNENSPDDDNAECNKENLVRLHRRATLRFSLRDNPKDVTTNSSSSRRRRKDIFDIWLSYANIHAAVGNLDESRRTFKYMEDNYRVLMDFSSSDHEQEKESGSASVFYLAYADFETKYGLDKSRAKQILLRGIKEKAEPISKLESALTVLDCSADDGSGDVTRRFRMKGTPASENKKDVSLGSIKFEINPSPMRENYSASQLKRRQLGFDGRLNSPKRRKSSEREPLSTHHENQQTASSEGERDQNSDGLLQNRKKVLFEVPSMVSSSSQKATRNSNFLSDTTNAPMTTIHRSSSQGKPPVSKTRLALTSRLTRKGLSGKAKRVDCSVTYDDDDFSSDDDTRHDDGKSTQKTEELSVLDEEGASSKSKSDKSSKVPSFKKLDLSYMWAWDPNKKGKDQSETVNQKSSDATNTTGSGQSTQNTHLSTIDTHGSGSSGGDTPSEKAIAASFASKNDQPKQTQLQLQSSQQTTPSGQTAVVTNADSTTAASGGDTRTPNTSVYRKEGGSGNDAASTHTEESAISKRQALVAKANLEFLPLVHEDNILRVRGSTYAKLGVIGKGGSCKVYRALSKKCSVVAIKKVKLAGMDRKAIEGYANEISLLKRLRGNPAIIQMYDSEVDLQRKSIFVVMELGEVDLNHVLQQRALSETSRSLNMNFIRLTWQQMLSAVHCIHEERIIHSDLKPANFLFVRGALKLIDFGIAKAIVNDDTTNIYRENHIGTLNYMSPEAILDTGSGQDGPRMKIGRASDVWSLGCILYEMVYGKTPFYKLHFIQKLQAIVNPNHKINYPDDDEAEAAIDAMRLCLRRNPEDRPPIVGKDGLLNEHWFLHSKRRPH